MSSVAVPASREPEQKQITRMQMDSSQEIELSVMPTPTDLVKRMGYVRDVVGQCMQDGVHYGEIPGTRHKTIWKPGIEVLTQAFMLTPAYTTVRHDLPSGHREYEITCTLTSRSSGSVVGVGQGSCSTMESKYRWRNAGGRVCPDCGGPFIRRSKYPDRARPDDQPGWYCHEKLGGCGSTFAFDDEQIRAGREEGRIENPDIADSYNTVLKMAQKRAHAAAISQALPIGEMFKGGIDVDGDEKRRLAEEAARQIPGVDPALLDRYFSLVRGKGSGGTNVQLLDALRRKAAKQGWRLDNEFFASRISLMENDGEDGAREGSSAAGPQAGAAPVTDEAVAPITDFGIDAIVQHVRVLAQLQDDEMALATLERWWRKTLEQEQPWETVRGATLTQQNVMDIRGQLAKVKNWSVYIQAGGKKA